MAAIELSKFIRNPDSLAVEEIARGRIELQQVRVDAKSDAVGCSMITLKAPERTRVAMISRGVDHMVPTAETVIEADDIVTIFGELGAKNCLTLIHRADYASAISSSGKHFGIAAAVSPRDATRREIERFITSDRFHLVKTLPGAEVIEMRVSKGSIAAGHMVHEIDWPEGCVLVGLMHGTHTDVPSPDDVIQAEDHIYAVVSGKARKAFVKLLD